LEILGKFSDEISYVRLMAVGLASSVLAVSFNEMAAETGVIQPVVLVLAHLLNFALAMIALFAHGVRLNMLEFSNNLGMEWSGYAYDPLDVKKRPGAEAAD
jgi:V/A-type H+-transporting ATPase subunit I